MRTGQVDEAVPRAGEAAVGVERHVVRAAGRGFAGSATSKVFRRPGSVPTEALAPRSSG